MPSSAQPYLWNSLLERLVGFRLYSVQFVMDYVQLRFDGPTRDEPVLNCDVMPVVETADGRAAPGGCVRLIWPHRDGLIWPHPTT